MKRFVNAAQALWEVQDLREHLVLARAEQVRMERLVREVVRDVRNREMVFGHGFVPYYTWPSEAVEDLRKLGRLAYLHLPGRANRVKPELLLRRYADRVAVVEGLTARLEGLEAGLRGAGVDTNEALPPEP